MVKVTHGRRRNGRWKACDPFCKDKLRIALYNRPNGPHMGPLKVGQTELTGLDSKCYSRTGKFKKGYRNFPLDLEREFKLERRQLEKIQDMVLDGQDGWEEQPDGTKKWVTKEERLKAKLKKRQMERERNAMLDVSSLMHQEAKSRLKKFSAPTHLPDATQKKGSKIKEEWQHRLNRLVNKGDYKETEQTAYTKRISAAEQKIKNMQRKEDESFNDFAKRVADCANKLTANEDKIVQNKLQKKREKNRMYKIKRKERQKRRKVERQQEEKERRRLEREQIKKEEQEEKEWIEWMKGKRARETVKFGEVNKLPPQSLHKLGEKLFGNKKKKTLKLGQTAEALTNQRRAAKMTANYQTMKSNRRKRELMKKR